MTTVRPEIEAIEKNPDYFIGVRVRNIDSGQTYKVALADMTPKVKISHWVVLVNVLQGTVYSRTDLFGRNAESFELVEGQALDVLQKELIAREHPTLKSRVKALVDILNDLVDTIPF